MEPKQFFKFCPKCGGELKPEVGNYLTCQKCGFKLFLNVSVAVGLIIENDNNEVLIAKRNYDPGKGQWDLVGGFAEGGEEPQEVAKREAKEELGVEIEILRLLPPHPDTYLYQGLVIPLMNIFYVSKITSGEIKADDDVADFKWVSKSELPNHPLWCPSLKEAVEDYLHS
jgi:ADP-ribose pyrophosphatase YjhB (NUDIX family)